MERFVADADQRNILESPIDDYYIFTIYDSAHGIIMMRQKWPGELRDDIRQGMTV